VVTAYILVQTEVGKAAQVAKDIAGIKGVQQTEDVTGPYDVIVRVERATSTSSAGWWSRAYRRSTASPGPSPVRWCTSRAARLELLDHLVVDGRQQQPQQYGPIAAVRGEGCAGGAQVTGAYERL